MKIYIAGKVSGQLIHTTTINFGTAQKQLEALGHEAINPLEVVNDWKAEWADAMKLCIKALVDCDAVLFLPDYKTSKGALLEWDIARKLGLKRYYSVSAIKLKEHDHNMTHKDDLEHLKRNDPITYSEMTSDPTGA